MSLFFRCVYIMKIWECAWDFCVVDLFTSTKLSQFIWNLQDQFRVNNTNTLFYEMDNVFYVFFFYFCCRIYAMHVLCIRVRVCVHIVNFLDSNNEKTNDHWWSMKIYANRNCSRTKWLHWMRFIFFLLTTVYDYYFVFSFFFHLTLPSTHNGCIQSTILLWCKQQKTNNIVQRK